MSAKTDARLTPRERLTRGLAYTAVGPVDITRGALGLTVNSTKATASGLRRRYRNSKVANQVKDELLAAQESIAKEISAAQELVANLPQTIADARAPKRRFKRPVLLAAIGVVTLAGGAVAFSVIRRSSKPEVPSARPPSVDIEPKP